MAKKKRPGRPKKPASQVRSADLRIPVTADEKRLIQGAVDAAGGRGELAAWARAVLIEAASKRR